VNQHAGTLCVETAEVDGAGDPQLLCEEHARSRVGLSGDEQSSVSVAPSQTDQGLDEVLPPLIPVEVAGIEAD
jgi:hypothetical protein